MTAIICGILTCINVALLMIEVKLFTEIVKVRELTRRDHEGAGWR